ncbi:hypothetical protein TI39_contig62g00008 [Zymoseptoria brevis]|uniref:Uncharacterized protein n=1 Tax=Zymoseptoria brevis TaxID=1047168 RepID=A0A0F4GYK6_9PEZI|nr:hypothetical protein TI39_contig62g00008 [Zymoseptoria brevis]
MVNYENCKLDELKKFVLRRKIPVELPNPKLRKTEKLEMRHHVRALKLADQNPYFPDFTGLPVEMRDMVYEELLGSDLDSARLNRGILSVDQQTHHEATNVLWRRNTVEIRFTSRYLYIGRERTHPYHPLGTTELFNPRWPEYLRKVQRLFIDFAVDTRAHGRQGPWPGYQNARTGDTAARAQDELSLLNHLLFSICSFLSARNDLKSLRLELSMTRNGIKTQHSVLRNPDHLIQCFRPLSMIAPLRELTIGGAEPTIATQVKSGLMGETLQPGIILSSWKHVYAAAKCCQRMREAADRMHIASPRMLLWKTLVAVDSAVTKFDGIMSHARRGRGHTPQTFVTRLLEEKLETQIGLMKDGLQRFKYRPDLLRMMEQRFARANEALVTIIDRKLSELTNLVGEIGTLIGRSNLPASTTGNVVNDAVMALTSRQAPERSNDPHWWLDVVVRFNEAKKDLDVALAHRALRKVLVVRLPMTDMRTVHDILANITRHTPLVDRLKSVRLDETRD